MIQNTIQLIENGKQSQIALFANDGTSNTYVPVRASALQKRVHATFDKFQDQMKDEPQHKLQRFSKMANYPGKLYDPLTLEEVDHHVQWKNREHASYYIRRGSNVRSQPQDFTNSSSSKAPMSQFHLEAQCLITDWINKGKNIRFVMKCNRNCHMVTLFETRNGMNAQKEVTIDDKNKRLDIAIFHNDEIVFNVEVLHMHRTLLGKRQGRWCEIIALHVIEKFQDQENKSNEDIVLICEPRDDVRVRCHFLDSDHTIKCCMQCIHETARACIRRRLRIMITNIRQRKQRVLAEQKCKRDMLKLNRHDKRLYEKVVNDIIDCQHPLLLKQSYNKVMNELIVVCQHRREKWERKMMESFLVNSGFYRRRKLVELVERCNQCWVKFCKKIRDKRMVSKILSDAQKARQETDKKKRIDDLWNKFREYFNNILLEVRHRLKVQKWQRWCSENDIDAEQKKLYTLAERIRTFARILPIYTNFTAPNLYNVDKNPATAIKDFKDRVENAESQMEAKKNKKMKLEERIELHKKARAEAVPYKKRKCAQFWKNSKGTKIMCHRGTKVIELCTPNKCDACNNAVKELACYPDQQGAD